MPEEVQKRKKDLTSKSTTLRNRVQESTQKEYIIDMRNLLGNWGCAERFAPQFQEIGNSGIEIDPGNEVRRKEDQLGKWEMAPM